MLPVLYKLDPNTPLKQAIVYALAVAVVLFAGWSGWRGAHGPLNPKTGKFHPPHRKDQLNRALLFTAIGIAIALFGLYYVLPSSALLGKKGEGIPLHTYGLLLAGGFVAAVSLSARLAEREWPGEEGERKREHVLDLSFWVLLSALLGSRILFIIVNWKDYAADPRKIFDLGGGLVFYGGLIGAIIASLFYAHRNRIEFLRLADVAMPTISLGQSIGRLGCFSAGCCWGDVTAKGFPLGVHFPGVEAAKTLFGQVTGTPASAYATQATDTRWVVESTGQLLHHAAPGAVRISDWVAQHGHTLPVHPTQLYESIGQFCLFLALVVARRYRRFHGEIFAIWLICYAILRSTVELFRGDVERGTLNGLLSSLGLTSLAERVPLEAWYNISISQFISLCMFGLGLAILYRRGREVFFQQPQPAPTSA
jgi:phosphatidylglycerol---prolipoprotein diacylglyceryl transferase